jgi:hypothetical protein
MPDFHRFCLAFAWNTQIFEAEFPGKRAPGASSFSSFSRETPCASLPFHSIRRISVEEIIIYPLTFEREEDRRYQSLHPQCRGRSRGERDRGRGGGEKGHHQHQHQHQHQQQQRHLENVFEEEEGQGRARCVHDRLVNFERSDTERGDTQGRRGIDACNTERRGSGGVPAAARASGGKVRRGR